MIMIIKNLSRFYVKSFSGCQSRNLSSASQPHMCIVGSGPSGFVAAQSLLKSHQSLTIDMFEKLPVPFGLIRYGVSPDHQDVKNCIHGYTKTAQSKRFSFFGNVNVGSDLSLSELCQAYHAVVLCIGAQGEQKLNIPGENLQNIFTSNQFVGWYNGVPEYQHLDIDLSGKNAVIIGVGNVALDVARMLFKPTNQLQETDITNHSLEQLSKSNISSIHLVGRRGPLQMACTRKELSEITSLSDVTTYIEPQHFNDSVQKALQKKDLKLRKYQRLIKYLQKVSLPSNKNTKTEKSFFVKFLRNPVRLNSKNGKIVSSITLEKRLQDGDDAFDPIITGSGATEDVECDLVISCIGYKNIPLDSSIPFKNGKIVQKNGRICLENGLYTCGWCSHGPKGVLADSGSDSLLTCSTILSDLPILLDKKSFCNGRSTIINTLHNKHINYVTWPGWEKIDVYEVANGEKQNKVREKVLTYDKMLSLTQA